MLRAASRKLLVGRGVSDAILRPAVRGRNAAHGFAPQVSVASHASGDTKGSYVELIASTSVRAAALIVDIECPGSNTSNGLIDIAVGASGSEVDVIAGILAQASSMANRLGLSYTFPIDIPAGSRISARAANSDGGETYALNVCVIGTRAADALQLKTVTTYGQDLVTTGGVDVDPGGTINTKGAWAELSAGVTRRTRGLLIAAAGPNGGQTTQDWYLDIGVGAAGSEVVIASNLHTEASATVDYNNPMNWGPFPVDIPAGTRLAARAQSTSTSGRILDVIAYGLSA